MIIIIIIVLLGIGIAGLYFASQQTISGEAPTESKEDRRVKRARQLTENEAFAKANLADHTEHQVMYIDDQKCLAGILSSAMAIEAYPLFETKGSTERDKIAVDLRSITFAELKSSKSLRRVVTTEREAKLVQHRKSPVMRGLVGTALLGPVGTVLGAASGLNSKIELKPVDRKVTRVVEANGPTTIVLGTTEPDRPVIRLRAASEAKTEEWFYRFRATLAT